VLGYLVKLSTLWYFNQSESSVCQGVVQTVSRAKAEVQKFAKDVLHWVNEMHSAFQGCKGGSSASKTKKNLEKIQ
jgi:hypothetical protein